MYSIGIESSCDETAAAVVKNGTDVQASIVASSREMSEKYGGIIPEIAAREQVKCILPVITEALEKTRCTVENIASIAVTVGPGLNGSLLVGVETAKTIAMVTGKPIIPVNHVIAHIYANFVKPPRSPETSHIAFPALGLVVSGGHTELYLMKSPKHVTWVGGTRDDAAGEALDKTARMLGMGWGGGPAIEKSAEKGRRMKHTLDARLPRPMIREKNFHFSFSGLKTAVMREIQRNPEKSDPKRIDQLSYEIQEAITDVLVTKVSRAAEKFRVKTVLLGGGVAANKRLREKMEREIEKLDATCHVFAPPPHLCTDNAVMVAICGYYYGKPTSWENVEAQPDLSVEV